MQNANNEFTFEVEYIEASSCGTSWNFTINNPEVVELERIFNLPDERG